jgi:TATA-box binding protein (TBP) (component of TFIID and TFIIIB)
MDVNENLRISTMTLISGIDSNINLSKLYENLETNEHIRYIEYGKNPVKGESIKKIKKPRKKKEKKFFYNQITLHVFKDKIVNVKIFNNGRIQMTGLKTKEQGIHIVEDLISHFKNIPQEKRETFLDNLCPQIRDSKIVLINSDFDAKFKIKREVLHRSIISMGYYSSYEPTIYPGVNIKYYFNDLSENGICKCEGQCNGKGNQCCKKITIAVFNSGKIIITGGQSYNHLNIAYHFIKGVIDEKKDELINK